MKSDLNIKKVYNYVENRQTNITQYCYHPKKKSESDTEDVQNYGV